MGAIPYQKQSTSSKPWNGPTNEKNLKDGQPEDYYSKMYAWVDPKGDPTTKAAYKFPHAEVSPDGTIGDVNIKACQSIIAILNGGMGGSAIPSADRQAVYDHVAHHLKDAGIAPADLRSRNLSGEMRSFSPLQAAAESGNILDGHPIIYGQQYQVTDWRGTYNEVVEPGALNGTDFKDVPFTLNHQINGVPLARSRSNSTNSTLHLSVDNVGLSMRATLDMEGNEEARKVYSAVKRGDITDMSYMFNVRGGNNPGEWWDTPETGLPTRHITDIARVTEVSAVTWGANPGTDISARSQCEPEGLHAPDGTGSKPEGTDAEQEKRNKEALELEKFKTQILERC